MWVAMLVAIAVLRLASPPVRRLNRRVEINEIVSLLLSVAAFPLVVLGVCTTVVRVAELPGDPDALTEEQLRTFTQGTGLEFIETVRVSRALLASFRRQAQHSGTTAV